MKVHLKKKTPIIDRIRREVELAEINGLTIEKIEITKQEAIELAAQDSGPGSKVTLPSGVSYRMGVRIECPEILHREAHRRQGAAFRQCQKMCALSGQYTAPLDLSGGTYDG